jgi:hypothetical protein
MLSRDFGWRVSPVLFQTKVLALDTILDGVQRAGKRSWHYFDGCGRRAQLDTLVHDLGCVRFVRGIIPDVYLAYLSRECSLGLIQTKEENIA